MRVVGIDPGKTGAASLLVDERFVAVEQMPDPACKLYEILTWWRPDLVIIEKVRAMPANIPGPDDKKRKMGAQSMFNFGFNAGVVDTVARLDASRSYGGEPVYVEASVWKRRAGLIGLGKEAALPKAKEVFSNAGLYLRHGRGYGTKDAAIGRADAILIARFGLGSTLLELL